MRALALLVLLGHASLAPAGVVAGRGLEAVAVSPDGKRLAAGGQNRVVYLLDADTLEVQKRIWLGTRVARLAFTADGKQLLAEDEADVLRVLEVATGKPLARRADVAGLVLAPKGGRLAVRDAAEPGANRLFFLDAADLKEKGRCELAHRPVAWAFDADGKTVAVLETSRANAEARVPLADVPRELAGLARLAYRQKNDGLGASLVTVEVPSGKAAGKAELWYTSDSDSTALFRTDETTYVLNRGNLCARVAAGGTALFETPLTINHALAVSGDGKQLWAGGLGRGTVGPLAGGPAVTFELPALPGQGELITAFAPRGGRAWAATSAFRVARVGKDGKVEKVAAVY